MSGVMDSVGFVIAFVVGGSLGLLGVLAMASIVAVKSGTAEETESNLNVEPLMPEGMLEKKAS